MIIRIQKVAWFCRNIFIFKFITSKRKNVFHFIKLQVTKTQNVSLINANVISELVVMGDACKYNGTKLTPGPSSSKSKSKAGSKEITERKPKKKKKVSGRLKAMECHLILIRLIYISKQCTLKAVNRVSFCQLSFDFHISFVWSNLQTYGEISRKVKMMKKLRKKKLFVFWLTFFCRAFFRSVF